MAASRLIAPVGTASTRTFSFASMRMMEPLPQLFSICAIARLSAFFLSSAIVDTAIGEHSLSFVVDSSGPRGHKRTGKQPPPIPEQSTNIDTRNQAEGSGRLAQRK